MKITSLIGTRMLILSLILVAVPTLIQAETTTGKVQSVIGDANVVLPSGKTEKITENMLIPAGSKLETTPDSKLVMQWMPGAMSVVGSGTTVAINSLAYSLPNGVPQRKVGLNLAHGTVFSHLAHNSGKSDFRIKTPTGVAAARGTDWSVTVSDKGVTKVFTITSEVDFTRSVDGFTVKVFANQVYVSDSTGKETTTITQQELDDIVDALRAAGVDVQPTFMPQIDQTDVNGPLRETPLPANSFTPNTTPTTPPNPTPNPPTPPPST